MIPVTKTYLPPLEEYVHYLEGIWERDYVTNNGPLVKELEQKLKEYLGVKHLFFVSNGTVAIQIAIRALELHGDVITTPFSYVATTSSIIWENCKPVFVDIDPETLCIDPDLIEAAITPETTAILAVHVFGYPCDVERIQAIADKYGLKVLYDAAHAFGVRYKDQSILNYGDASTLSFHATKLFHTVEGGAIITDDDDVAFRIGYMRNFGHHGQEDFYGLGINGKNSELHAAMGLCLLPRVGKIINDRRRVFSDYDHCFENSRLKSFKLPPFTSYNYAYYPVLFESEEQLIRVKTLLNERDIFPRRYFYPSLSNLPYLSHSPMKNSEYIAQRILCLPLFDSLDSKSIQDICSLILNNLS